MKNLRLLCLLLLSIFFCEAFAQDIHFSQYFASPLTLNPAATGNFYGSFRVAANYRNQWFGPISNNAPYQTFSGSFDVSVLKQELDIDHMGFGIMFFNDRAGDGNLTTQSVMLSAAYHKGLDSRDKHHIGFGVQGGMVQKRVDFSKLKFEEQWDGESSFNPALWNHENVRAESILYPDFNFGVFGQTTLSDNVNANIGFGYYHVFTPTESFL
ncbi:MAG TPA: PorP/SprF family type IX secretion system membrane protein, partial [Flavobacterium sp.]|nr:PorP/SprF family type IX secretion system membrane protein [Flavobacterium sp.]